MKQHIELACKELTARDRRAPALFDMLDDSLRSPVMTPRIPVKGVRQVATQNGPFAEVHELTNAVPA